MALSRNPYLNLNFNYFVILLSLVRVFPFP